MTRKLFIIGIGAGDPEQVTVQAIRAIETADVFFLFEKGEEKAELVDLRLEICARYATAPHRFVRVASPSWPSRDNPDYRAVVAELNARKEAQSRELISAEIGQGECGAILVWGDPSLYDSTIRIVERIAAGDPGLDYEVIPGISSIQALAARHRTTLNRVGGAVQVTTGRRLATGFPQEADDVAVMLDAEGAFRQLLGENLEILYGAYVGMADERLIAGPLDEVAEAIETYRREARARKGWIMDSYILRRRERR